MTAPTPGAATGARAVFEQISARLDCDIAAPFVAILPTDWIALGTAIERDAVVVPSAETIAAIRNARDVLNACWMGRDTAPLLDINTLDLIELIDTYLAGVTQ